MALRKYFVSKSREEAGPSTSQACATQSPEDADVVDEPEMLQPQKKRPHLTPSEKKRAYKSQLSYKPEWEKKYAWVYCTDPNKGMFCRVCQKWGTPPAGKVV